jgi:hypothetical protein
MRLHRHERHWVSEKEQRVYSHALCGADTWIEEIVDVEGWYFRQALEESFATAVRAFDDMKPPIINDTTSCERSLCEECEALFGFKVLGDLP